MKRKIIKYLPIVIIIIIVLLNLIKKYNNNYIDAIKYNGKTYILLEYNMDIFTYYYNSNSFYEEDIIFPIPHNKWDVVYLNGDLFVLDNQVKKTIKYYSDDKNYNWYIVFDNGENEIKKSINISDDELMDLYDIEQEEKSNTIVFDDIEMFGDVLKISKDGLVQGIVTLAKVDGTWYYKTEIMTDDDREYVIKINDSLNDKINKLF